MLNTIGVIADVLGILSFFVGLPTLFTTMRIKTSLKKHIAKSAFMADIDSNINDLMSFYKSIQDDKIFTNDLLERIIQTLDDVMITYDGILPKKIVSDMKKLEKHIKENCYDNLDDESAKRTCKTMLRNIATKLRREKKLL